MVDVPALCERYIKEAEPPYRKAWEQFRDLWAGQPAQVDLRWAFHDAFNACHTIVAMYMREAEPVILDDVRYISRLIGEVEPIGSACVLRVEEDDDESLIHINMSPLSPVTVGEALATLDAARRILGQLPIDLGQAQD